MSGAAERRPADTAAQKRAGELVTMTLAGQDVAIPVSTVQDVLGPQPLTPVPLSEAEIAGLLNLRGRIVTAIDLRVRLGTQGVTSRERAMNIVIDHDGELYSLLVDSVGDVVEPPTAGYACDTSLLKPCWRNVAAGVYALDSRLLVALDIERVLNLRAP